MNCIIDGTVDEKYLSLGLWGKPVIYYAISSAVESGCFDKIYVVTRSKYIEYLVNEFYENDINVLEDFICEGLIIDGRAANITKDTIRNLILDVDSHKLISIMDCFEEPDGHVLVDSRNNFELSLVLCKNRNKPQWLRKMIVERIIEKEEIFNNSNITREICLVGHSQIDQWKIDSLCGMDTRNCGISGITAREYIDDIIDANKLCFGVGPIIVLLGVNDIATTKSVDDISNDIIELLDDICKKTTNQIFFLEILHVNGRLDRDNYKINELNKMIKRNISPMIKWIPTGAMDDLYGNLNYKYTSDGLHLNSLGYEVLKKILESEINGVI